MGEDAPRCSLRNGSGSHVPVSLGTTEVIETMGKHQQLTPQLPVVVAWPGTDRACLTTCAWQAQRQTAVAQPCQHLEGCSKGEA